jgi:hypothetical protein
MTSSDFAEEIMARADELTTPNPTLGSDREARKRLVMELHRYFNSCLVKGEQALRAADRETAND